MDSQTRRLNAHGRHLQALELRKAAATYQVIADQLGYANHSGARKAVKSAMKAVLREPLEELFTLEAERLDAAQLAIWKRCLAGDDHAIDRLLGIMKRRAELLGLRAPARSALDVVITDEMLEREVARLEAEIERDEAAKPEDLSCLTEEEHASLEQIRAKLDADHEKRRRERRERRPRR